MELSFPRTFVLGTGSKVNVCSWEQAFVGAKAAVYHRAVCRNGSGRPGGCRTNNLTSKNFYVHIISIFENVS